MRLYRTAQDPCAILGREIINRMTYKFVIFGGHKQPRPVKPVISRLNLVRLIPFDINKLLRGRDKRLKGVARGLICALNPQIIE